MTGVLRIYDPAECDEHGVPLDWERCRCQREVPGGMGSLADALFQRNEVCPDCGGHGSLKAAALAALTRERDGMTIADMPIGPEAYRRRVFEGRPVRCEGCGHPMSDGTWEAPQGPPPGAGPGGVWGPPRLPEHAAYLSAVEDWLRGGGADPRWAWVHWSPCDEGCRHAGPGRMDGPGGRDGKNVWMNFSDLDLTVAEWTQQALPTLRAGLAVEASWRAVDIRTLGWPHDLRPDKLATLCTRCWADRTRA